MAPARSLLGSPPQLAACCEVARWLYAPEEVWPYLRQDLLAAAIGSAEDRLRALLDWLAQRVEPGPEGPLVHPERWRSPGEVLWHGAGGRAEQALLLWSAAPLVGLSRGRLVLGTCGAEPHAWVEWPELALFGDATVGISGPLGQRPEAYAPQLQVWPPLESTADQPAA